MKLLLLLNLKFKYSGLIINKDFIIIFVQIIIMLKTGIIIEAILSNDNQYSNITINRIGKNNTGDEWVQNRSNDEVLLVDLEDYVSLLTEGITTVILSAHDLNLKDSAAFFRETLTKLENAFVTPAFTKTTIEPGDKKYFTK